MKKSFELKQERTAKVEAQQTLVDKAKDEKRDFTEDEATKFDGITDEIRALDKQIQRADQIEANEKTLAQRNMAPVTTDTVDGEGKEKQNVYKRASLFKALRNANPANSSKLDGAEKEMHEIGTAEQRSVNATEFDDVHLSIPMSYLGRADQQTVSQDSGNYGGNLVQAQPLRWAAQLTPDVTVMEKLGASFWTGLSGGDIPIIVGSDFDMAFMAETAAITVQKKTFTGPTLSPNRAGGAVDISNRLLLQSTPDIEAEIKMQLVKGFNRLVTQACIEGTTYITGLATYSGLNVAPDVAAVVPTWAKMVKLKSLIFADNATRESLGYLIHPELEGILEVTSKDSGSGQYILQNGRIGTQPYQTTSLITPGWDGVPTYPAFFGDWSQMKIGQWGAINVTINPYSADLNNSLRLVLNTYADMVIANPLAFSRNLFFAETAGS